MTGTCGYSKETLALYVENDLEQPADARKIALHVSECPACRRYCDELRKNQSFVRSCWQSNDPLAIDEQTLRSVRNRVISRIGPAQSLGWMVKLERFLLAPLRKQRYAVAGAALIAVVSLSVVAQIGRSVAANQTDALNQALFCPSYHDWVSLARGLKSETAAHRDASGAADVMHNVYIDPAAYREYSRSGAFPEGAVLVLETVSVESNAGLVGLDVSVKDKRFGGGWAYYQFMQAGPRTLKPQAQPVAQSAGCVACHEQHGTSDHVFTQFYPALKGVGS